MIIVQISEILEIDPAQDIPQLERLLEEAARCTLESENLLSPPSLQERGEIKEGDVTLVLTDDNQLQALNREFLEIDAPTDVLSFPAGEADPETGAWYWGDVIISYPRASAQAAAGGHALQDELRLLAVHGVLHLLGYDHGSPAEQEPMWSRQADILRQLGSAITGPTP